MKNEDYMDYINYHLTERELLEQMAGAAIELAQAAMETCRTLENSNATADIEPECAWEHIDEGMVDVMNTYCALCGTFSVGAEVLLDSHGSPKWEGWYQRVKAKQETRG